MNREEFVENWIEAVVSAVIIVCVVTVFLLASAVLMLPSLIGGYVEFGRPMAILAGSAPRETPIWILIVQIVWAFFGLTLAFATIETWGDSE